MDPTLPGISDEARLPHANSAGGEAFVLRLQWDELGDSRPHDGYWGTVIEVGEDPALRLGCPREAIQFYVPRSPRMAGAEDERVPEEQLRRLSSRFDPTVAVLGRLLRSHPRGGQPEVIAVLGQVATALRWHVINRYGDMREAPPPPRGGLAPWQLRRATEMLQSQLTEDPCVAEIARCCGLSASHFGRAFRQTTGLPPHRWLCERRIATARRMLEETDAALSEVALLCGFTDQSHFTRVFSAVAGVSPGRWRRQRQRQQPAHAAAERPELLAEA